MANEHLFDEGLDPRAPAGVPPAAADELGLLDRAQDPTPFVIDSPEPAPLGRSYAYDFIQHAFLGDEQGITATRGLDTLALWIEKTLHTPRGGAAAVDPDFGLEGLEDVLDGGSFDAGQMAALEDRITDALMIHPRISAVEDFDAEYEPGDDAVFVSFTVTPEGEDVEDLVLEQIPVPIGA